jgi:hypothetical protein
VSKACKGEGETVDSRAGKQEDVTWSKAADSEATCYPYTCYLLLLSNHLGGRRERGYNKAVVKKKKSIRRLLLVEQVRHLCASRLDDEHVPRFCRNRQCEA